MASDMDRHVPSWRRHHHHRGGVQTVRPSSPSTTASSGDASGAEGQDQQVTTKSALELERENLLELARLNSAQSIEEIERQINRVLVEANLDREWLQELLKAEELSGKTSDAELIDDDMDEDDIEHVRDLEEALDEIPTRDPEEESFETFRSLADQLIQAGGVISYTYNGSDKYKRELKMPVPLPTSKTFTRSIEMDNKHKAAKGNDVMAQTWKSLAKNPNIGEQKRLELTRQLARTINRLSKPNPLDTSAYLTEFK